MIPVISPVPISADGYAVVFVSSPAISQRVYSFSTNAAFEYIYGINQGSASLTGGFLKHERVRANAPLASYTAWVNYAAVASLSAVIIGLLAAIVNPGPFTGAIFPAGMVGIWLTSKVIRGRA